MITESESFKLTFHIHDLVLRVWYQNVAVCKHDKPENVYAVTIDLLYTGLRAHGSK